MKKNIHPDYMKCTISCACGNVIETYSTVPEIKVEICSNCHPFFTGKQKLIDTAGRVEQFRRKYGMTEEGEGEKEKGKGKEKTEAVTAPAEAPESAGESPEEKEEAVKEEKGTETGEEK